MQYGAYKELQKVFVNLFRYYLPKRTYEGHKSEVDNIKRR